MNLSRETFVETKNLYQLKFDICHFLFYFYIKRWNKIKTNDIENKWIFIYFFTNERLMIEMRFLRCIVINTRSYESWLHFINKSNRYKSNSKKKWIIILFFIKIF